MTATWAEHIIARKLNGTLCKQCGTLIGSKGKGVPRNCDTCLDTSAIEALEAARGAERDKMLADRTCPVCGAVLRSLKGRDQHVRMMHSQLENERLLA